MGGTQEWFGDTPYCQNFRLAADVGHPEGHVGEAALVQCATHPVQSSTMLFVRDCHKDGLE
jgi:hypothetical protein